MAAPTRAEALLARRLRQLRDNMGLTQTELAKVFSTEKELGSASISSWENTKTSASPPRDRLEPYARVDAILARQNDAELVDHASLSDTEAAIYRSTLEELHRLWDTARGVQEQDVVAGAPLQSWVFDEGPVAIVCPEAPPSAQGPLINTDDPNYTQAHAYADLDALIELFGHIRAVNNPQFKVSFKLATEVKADDLSGHLVILGGVAWNQLTRHLLRSLGRLPVRQMTTSGLDTGEIFAVGHGPAEIRYEPEWEPPTGPRDVEDEKTSDPVLVEDVALLARLPNPYNSSRTLTICNGIHSRGVLGAVRVLTDVRVREANEAYLAERFSTTEEYAVLMRVPVFQGEAISPDLRKPENRLYEWPARGAAAQ